MKPNLLLTAAALCLGSSAAFTSIAPARPATHLSMAKNDGVNNGKTLAASALAAAFLLAGAVSPDAAFAMDGPSAPSFADSSSVTLAGRSGGRAGGRSAPRAMPRQQAPRSAGPTVINKRTTIIQAPPVVMGGGYGGYGGYGYGGGGLGLNGAYMGLSAVNAIGNGMRESRQNEMIATERAELGASKEREAEMSARLRQLEMMQMQQAGAGQAQPQVIYAQPPVQQAAPAQ